MRFLLVLSLFVSLFQPQTALEAVVVDAQNQPIAGVQITLQAEDGSISQLQTDETGFTQILPLLGGGEHIVVTAALLADGQHLRIEPTTLDSLRLGLVPDHTRTVLFRVSDGVFAVDPETIFAGPEIPPTVATMQAALPEAAPTESVPPTAESAEQPEQPAPVESVPEQAATTTPIQEDPSEYPTPLQELVEPKQARGQNLRLIALVAFIVGALAGGVLWYLARKRGQQ